MYRVDQLGTQLDGVDLSGLSPKERLAAKKAAKAAKKAAESASSASATTTTSATTNTADTSTDQTPASDDPVTAGDASSEPEIVAYSQQSRFHRETFDANTTDIDIKGVNISIGSKDILVDANLRLKAGFKYGMVGQNGVGKSVLMSVLGNNILIGLPQNVRFLHVKQLEEFAPGRTILQEVLEADSERVRVIQEAKVLQAINPSSKSYEQELNIAIHALLLNRSSNALALAQKIATKRSGQRGYVARQDLLALEASHAELAAQDPQAYVTPKMASDVMKEVFDAYEALDVEADEVRARSILKGLGFKEEEMGVKGEEGDAPKGAKEVGKLSGGWRMRVMLAKALFIEPDVLLLDEPTNHLDLPAIMWLEHHLLNNPSVDTQTVVIVSHDRAFLDSVTTETIIFREKKLQYHPGNYDDWEKNTEEQRKRKMRLKELDDKRKKKILASIQKNVQQAKSTGDDKRLGMVASRRKALDRMGMQQLEDGKRYKRSYHGYREEIVIDHGFSRVLPITLPTPYPVPGFSPPSTMTSSILQLSEVSYRYPGTRKDVIDNVSLDISPTARIGFLGPNGCGKSTLMDLLAGVKKPTKGEVKGHHRLRIGYFSQHTVDSLNLGLTPLEQLREFYPPSKGGSADPEDYQAVISEAQARAHFATVGITGNIITKQTIKTLSGGQRNRVALGCVTYTQPHLLLLDEITNHLDMGSVESIVESLRGFEGAVVVVSHDVWFLRQVVMGDDGDDGDDDDDGSDGGEKGEGGVLYIVNGKFGGLRRWEQGLDEYVERVRKRAWKAAVAATGG